MILVGMMDSEPSSGWARAQTVSVRIAGDMPVTASRTISDM
jgi:hypothetical protein